MILAMLFTIFTASTLDAMRYLLALGITLPVVWLTQARQEITVAEEPQPEHGVRHALVPGYGDNPGMLRR